MLFIVGVAFSLTPCCFFFHALSRCFSAVCLIAVLVYSVWNRGPLVWEDGACYFFFLRFVLSSKCVYSSSWRHW